MTAPMVAQVSETWTEWVNVPPLGEIDGMATVGKGLTVRTAAGLLVTGIFVTLLTVTVKWAPLSAWTVAGVGYDYPILWIDAACTRDGVRHRLDEGR